ncbi:MAG TPA: methyltransferase domain-containing protein [Chitinophagaceae bacterium]|nr:methyltransferase domain-containing protein [Chitinophagaceae bacterium]
MIHPIIRYPIKRILQELGLRRNHPPMVGTVALGDLKRIKPFSKQFGFDRGGAIDRYYIENFLQQETGSIRGKVLEIGDNSYTTSYGGDKVTKSEVLHVNENNKNATIIGDISSAPQIPDNTFDCIILTQTLHLIYNFKDALQTCYRILKPGGALLLTVPGITPIDHGEWNSIWYWSFTDKSMSALSKELFRDDRVEINTFGNVRVASSFLYGLGLKEITKEILDYSDPHFQVIITVKAVK